MIVLLHTVLLVPEHEVGLWSLRMVLDQLLKAFVAEHELVLPFELQIGHGLCYVAEKSDEK